MDKVGCQLDGNVAWGSPMVNFPLEIQSLSIVAISRFSSGDTIRTGRYRYTIYRNKEGEISGRMLYDHSTDPNENTNIAGNPENRPLIEELEARLLRDMGKPTKR